MNPTPTSLPTQDKRYFIKTFGCQMNEADTERMQALLGEGGMQKTDTAEDADLIVVNGCSVREKAVHEATSFLGTIKTSGQARGKKPIIAVGGCVGQLNKRQLFKNAPYLDFVFGPDAIDQLPEMVFKAEHGAKKQVYVDFDQTLGYSTRTKIYGKKVQAYVNT